MIWLNNLNKNVWGYEQHLGSFMPSSHLVIYYEVDEQANKKTIFIFVGLYNKLNKELHESSHIAVSKRLLLLEVNVRYMTIDWNKIKF
jgi:hypothetical protein